MPTSRSDCARRRQYLLVRHWNRCTNGFDDPDDLPPIAERTYRKIQSLRQQLYSDSGVPKLLRRRILEVSVRAPEDWHRDAIGEAYASDDNEWILTAVFAMRYLRDFDAQMLEALNNPDPEIRLEAVEAADNWAIDAAWPYVVKLVEDANTSKPLLLAAIGAAGRFVRRRSEKSCKISRTPRTRKTTSGSIELRRAPCSAPLVGRALHKLSVSILLMV